jgi:hypothetical protein
MNRNYLKDCLRDSLARGEHPFASHEMYTRALDDNDPTERMHGILAGFAWATRAEARIFYLDRGLSKGMVSGLRHAAKIGQPIYIRGLAEWRGPLRLEALRKLNGELPSSVKTVDWSGF